MIKYFVSVCIKARMYSTHFFHTVPAFRSAGQIIFVKKCHSTDVSRASPVWASMQLGSNTSTDYRSLDKLSLQKFKVLYKILSWLDILRWNPDPDLVTVLFCSFKKQQVADQKSAKPDRLFACISVRSTIEIVSCKIIYRECWTFLLTTCCQSKWCAALTTSAVVLGRNLCLCHFCSNISHTTISLCPSPYSDPDKRRNSLLNLMLVIPKYSTVEVQCHW